MSAAEMQEAIRALAECVDALKTCREKLAAVGFDDGCADATAELAIARASEALLAIRAPLPDESMVERVAEAMCRAAGFSPNEPVYGTGTSHGGIVVLRYKLHDFIPLARAAIRAINGGEP